MKRIKHVLTITWHKLYVLKYCTQAGYFFRGLWHDLSKYSLEELSAAKYYTGNRSALVSQRNDIGYSKAWIHHKGRNKHHYEYWLDYTSTEIRKCIMPFKYCVEMICDMLAAGKVYQKKNWNKSYPIKYIIEKENHLKLFSHSAIYNFIFEVMSSVEEIGINKTLKKKYLKKIYLKCIENKDIYELLEFK